MTLLYASHDWMWTGEIEELIFQIRLGLTTLFWSGPIKTQKV